MKFAIVGGGPAGLRAAEVAASGGAHVTLFDAMPSVGRKFLVAGKGGLNITKDEPLEQFAARYRGPGQPEDFWRERIAGFGQAALREWASGLGVETFVASTGRVYPRELKAAPLLRRWVQRLRSLGVEFAMRHRWIGFAEATGADLRFQTPDGERIVQADAAILALGGGSWPETGSDGAWIEIFAREGIEVAPLVPANCGWECDWPASLLAVAEGQPVKSIAVSAGEERILGELLITRYGLEGGALYQLGPVLRDQAKALISIDLKPTVSIERLLARLGTARKNLLEEAETRWRLTPAATALLALRVPFTTPESIAQAAKNLEIPLTRPRPLAEAISSAGGVRWSEVDENLMLRRRPGVYVAGEMLDWEAPTGGYLIHGCIGTSEFAAKAVVT